MLEKQLSDLASGALGRILAAGSPQELETVRVDALGRKGSLAQISKEMGKVAPEERARIGKLLNAAKQELEGALESRQQQFAEAALQARLDAEWVDLTLPAPGPRMGHLHPITQIQTEIEDLFVSLGFTVLDGPEVETEYYNFDALNIPADHPARDMQDTFWLTDGNLLRTHTSPVQVRGMERLGPPLRNRSILESATTLPTTRCRSRSRDWAATSWRSSTTGLNVSARWKLSAALMSAL